MRILKSFSKLDWNFTVRDSRQKILFILNLPILLVFIYALISVLLGFFGGFNSVTELIVILSLSLPIMIALYALINGDYYISVIAVLVIFYGCAIYSFLSWGLAHPYGLILFVVSINLSFILLPTKFAIRTVTASIIVSFLISMLQAFEIINYDWNWNPVLSSLGVLIIFILILVSVLVLFLYENSIEILAERISTVSNNLNALQKDFNQKIISRTKRLFNKSSKLVDTYETLEKAYGELEGSEQNRFLLMNSLANYGSLLSVVAHDISSYVMIIEEYLRNPEVMDSKEAQHAMTMLRDTVQSLRKFTPSERSYTDFSVNESIEDVCNLLAWKIKRFNVEVRYNFSNNNTSICGDREKFLSIILNLIDNALDAVRNKFEPIIIIECGLDDCYGFIKISDNGTPLSGGEDVFKMFYSTKEEGSGLGLYLSRLYARNFFHGDVVFEGKSAMEGFKSFKILYQIKGM